MEDNLSMKSSDSLTTSGEYEIVPATQMLSNKADSNADEEEDDDGGLAVDGVKVAPASSLNLMECKQTNASGVSPELSIANNGDLKDLEKNLTEVFSEFECNQHREKEKVFEDNMNTSALNSPDFELSSPMDAPRSADGNKIGHSVFYDCMDRSPIVDSKDDTIKTGLGQSDTEEEMSDIDQDCTIFSGVTYLGAAAINAPKSKNEIHRNMSELNDNSVGLEVSVSIPSCPEGLVILHDTASNTVVAHYEVNRILFYARGPQGSKEQACFAFTWSHGDSVESAIFQCHVFRCHIPEAVNQVSTCFQKAFQRLPQNLSGSVTSAADSNSLMMSSITSDITGNPISSAEYEFIVALEIKEKVTKSTYSAVPRDRSCFKLRCNTDKEIVITVKQTPSTTLPTLYIERCFGILLSAGKLVRQSDMQLLDMVTMGYVKTEPATSATVGSTVPTYSVRAEWKANDKNFEQLNTETHKTPLTVAVDLVIKGIQEPVRFIIETFIVIQSQNEMRLIDHFISKKSMMQRFYLQLKENKDGVWDVSSIDPSEEINEPSTQASSLFKNLGINNLSRIVRSSSVISIQDESPSDEYSSDGDEPLLSGTGEVSKDCSQDTLDEWGPVLQEWTNIKRPKALANLVRLGIPEALRGRVWPRLANADAEAEMIDKYRVFITMESKCETVIQRDIHRTFPAHKFFRETGGSGQDALFKVSKAYAVYDSEVGYCQGLSFIAASLLLHMPEEEAFCVLVALMYKYGLRDLYKHGFENLYLRLYQLKRLMKDHLPKLHDHFEQMGVETHMFASQWFLTLFTARFPLYLVFHILDVFLLEGIPILFQVALTLLSVCENDLRQLDFEGILKYFRVQLPKKCRSHSQAKKLMKSACERKIKKLRQYQDEFLKLSENSEKDDSERIAMETKTREELSALKALLSQTKEKAEIQENKTKNIIVDYKQIIQRQEQQITELNDMLGTATKIMSRCAPCSTCVPSESPLSHIFSKLESKTKDNAPLGPLDPLNIALQRIRELEVELAETKLAHVEAECKNQDLNHQLNTTLTEIQNHNKSGWQPWISKTLNSIQEKVAAKRDIATFQSYTAADLNNYPQMKSSDSTSILTQKYNYNLDNKNDPS